MKLFVWYFFILSTSSLTPYVYLFSYVWHHCFVSFSCLDGWFSAHSGSLNPARHEAERLKTLLPVSYLTTDTLYTSQHIASFFISFSLNASSPHCSFPTSCVCGELFLDSRVESLEGAPQSAVELQYFIIQIIHFTRALTAGPHLMWPIWSCRAILLTGSLSGPFVLVGSQITDDFISSLASHMLLSDTAV